MHKISIKSPKEVRCPECGRVWFHKDYEITDPVELLYYIDFNAYICECDYDRDFSITLSGTIDFEETPA